MIMTQDTAIIGLSLGLSLVAIVFSLISCSTGWTRRKSQEKPPDIVVGTIWVKSESDPWEEPEAVRIVGYANGSVRVKCKSRTGTYFHYTYNDENIFRRMYRPQ